MGKNYEIFPIVAFAFSVISVIPYIFIFMLKGNIPVSDMILLTIMISGTVAVSLGFISLALSRSLKVKNKKIAGTAFCIGIIALVGYGMLIF